MITIDYFTEHIKKSNTDKYLKSIVKRANNGEGYCSLRGNHVIFNKYLTGYARKQKDRWLELQKDGLVKF